MPSYEHAAVLAVGGATVTAILTRPRGIPEWCWAIAGAAILLVAGLLPADAALRAAWDGLDVYLFLAGMLLLAELARAEGVFDWLAALVVPAAGGSTKRLFGWVFALGIGVTAMLSNDATVVLLTPAVLAVVRRAGATPLPFLFACAFVANAASFILPISNPANLVVFHRLPSLGSWLAAFALPSLLAIACTYFVLRYLYGKDLEQVHDAGAVPATLGPTGKLAGMAVGVSALLIVACAGIGWRIGPTTFVLGVATFAVVAARDASCVRTVMRDTPWSIIPLVAGLFVIVAALDRSGVLAVARTFFQAAANMTHPAGELVAGAAVTIAANVFNNLPVGVLARYAVQLPNVPTGISHAILVAVDLGPNLSVTGSLATLLWLIALRREGIAVTPLQFVRIGAIVTIPALFLALLTVS